MKLKQSAAAAAAVLNTSTAAAALLLGHSQPNQTLAAWRRAFRATGESNGYAKPTSAIRDVLCGRLDKSEAN